MKSPPPDEFVKALDEEANNNEPKAARNVRRGERMSEERWYLITYICEADGYDYYGQEVTDSPAEWAILTSKKIPNKSDRYFPVSIIEMSADQAMRWKIGRE